MNISKYIKEQLKEQGRSQKWLAEKLLIDEKTFAGKLNRDSITAQELLQIANIIDLDLSVLMEREADVVEDNASKRELLQKLRKDIANKFKHSDISDIKLVVAVTEWWNAYPNGNTINIEGLVNHDPKITADGIIEELKNHSEDKVYYLDENIHSEDAFILNYAIAVMDYDDEVSINQISEEDIQEIKDLNFFISSLGCVHIDQ